jgi:hypothetical protein
MFDNPIRYIRVKNEIAVKMRGAIINSHSSRTARYDLGCSKQRYRLTSECSEKDLYSASAWSLLEDRGCLYLRAPLVFNIGRCGGIIIGPL